MTTILEWRWQATTPNHGLRWTWAYTLSVLLARYSAQRTGVRSARDWTTRDASGWCPYKPQAQKRTWGAAFGQSPVMVPPSTPNVSGTTCFKFNCYNGDCRYGKQCRFGHVCSRCGGSRSARQLARKQREYQYVNTSCSWSCNRHNCDVKHRAG